MEDHSGMESLSSENQTALPGVLSGPRIIRHHNPPRPAKRLHRGCNGRYALGLCQTALIQRVCEAKFGPAKGRSVEAACSKLYPDSKDAMYETCLAIAYDVQVTKLGEAAPAAVTQELREAQCEVANLAHFDNSNWLYMSKEDYSMAYTQDDTLPRSMLDAVIDQCNLLIFGDGFDGGYDTGFCTEATEPGQDCELASGIKGAWTNDLDHGKTYCESLTPTPAVYHRCLALRRQFINDVKQSSSVGTAHFSSFDDTWFAEAKCN